MMSGLQSAVTVPNSVYYSQVKPLGYATKASAFRFQPTGFIQGNIGNSDIVRFIISMNGGYWDPYSVYIALVVSLMSNTVLANDTSKGYVAQLDSSAQSFFQSLIIYKDGKELERIMEYDTAAAILNDLNYDPADRFQREQEGTGGMLGSNVDAAMTNFSIQGTPAPAITGSGPGNIPSQNPLWHFNPRAMFDSYSANSATAFDASNQVAKFTAGSSSGSNQLSVMSMLNTIQIQPQSYLYSSTGFPLIDSTSGQIQILGPFGTGASAGTGGTGLYTISPDQAGISAGTTLYAVPFVAQSMYIAVQSCAPLLAAADYNLAPQDPYNPSSNLGYYGGGGTNINSGALQPLLVFDPWNPSKTTLAPWAGGTLQQNNATCANTDIGQGFSTPFVNNFCCTTFETKFTNYNVLRCIQNGVITNTNNLVQTFYFPLISGLLGILIPAHSYKLLPLSALREMVLEFKMSPYALFTSNNLVPRTYQLNKFEIVAEIIELDPTTMVAVESQCEGEGWIFNSVSWFLGPTYNITANNIPGQIQINLGFDSLKSILLLFLAGDYQSNNAARKQYRLSQNIVSLQLQIGAKYFPQQPVTGNSGSNLGQNNNGEFYINTLKAFNRLHQVGSPHIFGLGNTAVNFRNWDPTANIWQSQSNAALPNGAQQAHQDSNYFLENSCVGKCAYGFDLEGFNYEDVIGGVNTIIERSPFCVNLSYQVGAGNWVRQSTAYVFCLYDLLVQISRQNVQTLGRA